MQSALETAGNGHAQIPESAFPKVLDFEINPPVDDFSTMHLREPTFQEVREAEKFMVRDAWGRLTDESSRLYQMTLISKVSGVSRQAIDKMRISEVNRAWAFLMRFREDGPATGEP
jgi:hypothetical protein